MLPGIPSRRFTQEFRPVIGNRSELWVRAVSQLCHQFRERVGKILVIANAETIPLHDDVTAKPASVVIQPNKRAAFFTRENGSSNRIASFRKRLPRAAPVQPIDPFGHVLGCSTGSPCSSHASSRDSSAFARDAE